MTTATIPATTTSGETPSGGPPATGPVPGNRVIALIMAAYCVFAAVFVARTSFVVDGRRYFTLFDDSMISMRYARNLAEGHGLTWNAGETPVEGFTNLLWTLWMAVLHLLPLDDRFVPLLVSITGAVLVLAAIWLSARLAGLLVPDSSIAPPLAAFFTAACYPFSFWTLRGMEVGLTAVIGLAAVILAIRAVDQPETATLVKLGTLLGAGVLTRPDTAIVAAIVIAFVVVFSPPGKRLKSLAVAGGLPVATFLALTAFRLGYYGEIVPNTYVLKVEGVPLLTRLARGTRVMVELLGKGGLLPVIVFALAGAWLTRHHFRRSLLPLAIVGAFLAYSVYVGGDAWEDIRIANRYVSGVLPLLLAVAAAGFATVVRGRHVNRRTVAACIAGLVAAAVLAALPSPGVDAADVHPNAFSGYLQLGLTTAVLACIALLAWRRPPARAAAALVLVAAVAVTGGMHGRALEYWLTSNAHIAKADRQWTEYGIHLAGITQPGATVAVTAAGAIAYWGPDQRFVDELGKMDPVVAGGAPSNPGFPPGHQKYNYQRSIGELRPDVVAQSFDQSPETTRQVIDYGYTQIHRQVFVRTGTTMVDVEALRAYVNSREF